jgi:hypothetical protein
MAVSMHSTTSRAGKGYSERAVPGQATKGPSTSSGTQQDPSRPSSAAPGSKTSKDIAKSPKDASEDMSNFKEGPSMSNDILRNAPPAGMTFPLGDVNMSNSSPYRTGTGGGGSQGYVPHPYFNSGLSMNVTSQTGYGTAPMQFYHTGFNPNPYPGSQPSQPRPGPAMQPKFSNMDPKYGPSTSVPVGPATVSPSIPNNMSRRPSSYFVPAPSMSPVQTSYGPRGWIGGNPAPMMPASMPFQNGPGSVQSAGVYNPAMLAPNHNPPMLTPPGPVPPAFTPPFGATSVTPSNPSFGYPTPQAEAPQGTNNPDIPPPVPSLYPDPAYNNINNCIYNPKGTTNVYIRGLRPETTDDDLLRMVRLYGEIMSTKAIIDTQTKLCKG